MRSPHLALITTAMLSLPLTLGSLAQEAPPHETRGTIDAVTVYRGQALITRVIAIPGPAGLHEVVVTDLPAQIVPGSLFAESSAGVEVRSVRYRVRPVRRDVRDDVRELDAQIREAEDALAANQHGSARLAERKAYLANLEGFTATTSMNDLQHGALDPAKLKEMTEFLFAERDTLAQQELTLTREQRDLNESLATLRQKRQQLTGGSARQAREAIVFVNLLDNAGGDVQLRYLVNNATWSPSYNVRGEEGASMVNLEYFASIQQMSGESWNDVNMSLSTATATLIATAPELDPLTIALATSLPEMQQAQYQQVEKARADLYARRLQAEAGRNQAPIFAGGGQTGQEFDASLNEIAVQLQVLELAAAADKAQWAAVTASDEESLSVTYTIDGRTSLPSRSDQQFLQIASIPMVADFYRQAAPVLTSAIFQEASLRNSGGLVLLEGPVSSYMDGQFVGRSAIPTIAAGEEFTVGFGIDASVRASRELVDRNESIQGGNRLVELTYELTLSNFAGEATDVRLVDRIPTTEDRGITLEFDYDADEANKDAIMEPILDKDGRVTWNISVPAHATGDDVLTLRYQIRLEYDKQMVIGGM